MDELISMNSQCADCKRGPVEYVNVKYGVFICEACSRAHKSLGLNPMLLNTGFSTETMTELAARGNALMNQALEKQVPLWVATPEVFDMDIVRLFFVENKYTHPTFSGLQRPSRVDLNKFWFLIDEGLQEEPVVKGPLSRSKLLALYDTQDYVAQCFVWHSALGTKWVVARFVFNIIAAPSDTPHGLLVVQAQHVALLTQQPPPRLQGAVTVAYEQVFGLKWAVLAGAKLFLYSENTALNYERQYSLVGATATLQKQGADVCIDLSMEEAFLVMYGESCELLEWFNELQLAIMQIAALGIVEDEAHFTDWHVCTVKSSPAFLGHKLLEGKVKVKLNKHSGVRWVVLRSRGLYLHKLGKLKNHGEAIEFVADSRLENGEKSPFSLVLHSESNCLTLMLETQTEFEEWSQALNKQLFYFTTSQPSQLTYQLELEH